MDDNNSIRTDALCSLRNVLEQEVKTLGNGTLTAADLSNLSVESTPALLRDAVAMAAQREGAPAHIRELGKDPVKAAGMSFNELAVGVLDPAAAKANKPAELDHISPEQAGRLCTYIQKGGLRGP